MKELKINTEEVKEKIVDFIRPQVKGAGLDKAVIGLSGGLDSSAVAYLAKEALGEKNAYGVILPYKATSKEDVEDGEKVNLKGLDYKLIKPLIWW